ncbi:hypothetical protein K438DRAFT_1972251 [Mycena galopus ATCC 62051]|nr:hypothetical protein K438DRAFT_1972251 [Mycena galopus ATCC 62051]
MSQEPLTIGSLASETLSEIFIYTLPVTVLAPRTQFRWPDIHVPLSTVSPLLLCQVSSHWRDIAINDPRLWTSLNTQFLRHSEFISLWLSRAGSMPLSLHLARPIHPPVRFVIHNGPVLLEEEEYMSTIHRHLPLLLPKIWSCKHLEMEDAFIPRYFRQFPAPFLESLSVAVRSSNTAAAGWFSSLMAHTPRLACLHWEGAPLTVSNVPWAQLTHLSLHVANLPVGYVAAVLEAAVQVQQLRLHLQADPTESYHSPRDPIIMPNVTTFNFSGDTALTRILTLPNMTSLIIEWTADVPDLQDLPRFLLRSKCVLTMLEVWEIPGRSPSGRGMPTQLLMSSPISSSLTRLLMPSRILNEFFLWLQRSTPGTLPKELMRLRDVDRCFRIDRLPEIEDPRTSGILAHLIKSRLRNLEVLYLDDHLLPGEVLESHHAGLGPTASFTVWRSATLLREYRAWWVSLEGSAFKAALATGTRYLIDQFEIDWDQISGPVLGQENRFNILWDGDF